MNLPDLITASLDKAPRRTHLALVEEKLTAVVSLNRDEDTMNSRLQAITHNSRIVLKLSKCAYTYVACLLAGVSLSIMPTTASSTMCSARPATDCLAECSREKGVCATEISGFPLVPEGSVVCLIKDEPVETWVPNTAPDCSNAIEEILVVGTRISSTSPGILPGWPPYMWPPGGHPWPVTEPEPPPPPETSWRKIWAGILATWTVYIILLDFYTAEAFDGVDCSGNSQRYPDLPSVLTHVERKERTPLGSEMHYFEESGGYPD